MDVIKRVFIQVHNKNLPLYGVTTKDLKEYTTTEKDMRKGTNKFPLENARIRSEDLLKIAEQQETTE